MKAPPVHHAAGRRCGRVAARGTGAAAGDAGGRVLEPASSDGYAERLRGFRQGLKDTGYVERDVSIDTIGARIKSIGCRCWRLNWFAAMSP